MHVEGLVALKNGKNGMQDVKPILSDNPNVAVYYWQKFVVGGAKRDKKPAEWTDNSEYVGSCVMRDKTRSRLASVGVYKKCINVAIYWDGAGVLMNIDWNDTDFIKLAQASNEPATLFSVLHLLWLRGYEISAYYGFDGAFNSDIKDAEFCKKEQYQLF